MTRGAAQSTTANAATSKRKRNVTAQSNDEVTQLIAKRSRTHVRPAGSLGKVLDVPFDVLMEIFGHLLPGDLLSLGRVSKDFRELVMSPGFKSIWIQSRAHFPNSPQCPDDITEPMFAELAFGKSCLMCKRNGSHIFIIWRSRTRLCTNCIADSFVSFAFIKRLKLPQSIQGIVPSIYARSKFNYCQKSAKKWAAEYHSLKTQEEKAEWEKTKSDYLRSVSRHAGECEEWMTRVSEHLAQEKMGDVTDRKAKILELANSMGWADELSRVCSSKLLCDLEIDKICRKPLTNASIAQAKAVIDRVLQKLKNARVEAEKEALYTPRMELLQETYDRAVKDWMPSEKAPWISDVFVVPRIRSVVVDTPAEVTVTHECFFDEDTFSSIVEEAKNIRLGKLMELIEDGYTSLKKGYDPAAVASLASTVFGKTFSVGSPVDSAIMTTPKALLYKGNTYWTQQLGLVERVAMEVFRYGPWNFEKRVVFHSSAHHIICNLIDMCGMDPSTTTLIQMNTTDPIFECVPCNSFYRGRLMMRWTEAASHIQGCHYEEIDSKYDFLEMPKTQDLERTRTGIKDAEERIAYSRHMDMRCEHCSSEATIVEMRRHLLDKHNIEYPTEDDWEYTEAAPMITVHWLWPPRPPTNRSRELMDAW
ncbi:hypothetical protein BJ165DRAFT_1495088 [Panaeolus papilionaceus]|nr:hypothetical protein BJ165DRAFT_1495088 [Panaeolus papilionaceus]